MFGFNGGMGGGFQPRRPMGPGGMNETPGFNPMAGGGMGPMQAQNDIGQMPPGGGMGPMQASPDIMQVPGGGAQFKPSGPGMPGGPPIAQNNLGQMPPGGGGLQPGPGTGGVMFPGGNTMRGGPTPDQQMKSDKDWAPGGALYEQELAKQQGGPGGSPPQASPEPMQVGGGMAQTPGFNPGGGQNRPGRPPVQPGRPMGPTPRPMGPNGMAGGDAMAANPFGGGGAGGGTAVVGGPGGGQSAMGGGSNMNSAHEMSAAGNQAQRFTDLYGQGKISQDRFQNAMAGKLPGQQGQGPAGQADTQSLMAAMRRQQGGPEPAKNPFQDANLGMLGGNYKQMQGDSGGLDALAESNRQSLIAAGEDKGSPVGGYGGFQGRPNFRDPNAPRAPLKPGVGSRGGGGGNINISPTDPGLHGSDFNEDRTKQPVKTTNPRIINKGGPGVASTQPQTSPMAKMARPPQGKPQKTFAGY